MPSVGIGTGVTADLNNRVVKRGRAWWHLHANVPVVAWLVTTLVVAVLRPVIPGSNWLLPHLLLLGGVSNAILIWSAHFAASLLRSKYSNTYLMQAVRLGMLNLGVVLVVAGVLASGWMIVVSGAGLIAGAVLWHGAVLARQMAGAAPAEFAVVVWFYVVAAVWLVVGVTLGSLLAGGFGGSIRSRLVVAHVGVNVLGWVGLTILSTLTILWPSMLRTRRAAHAAGVARVVLVVLNAALGVLLAAVLAGWQLVAGVGVWLYLAGLLIASGPLVAVIRQRRPASYASLSVLAGCGWLAGSLAMLGGLLLARPGWDEAGDRLGILVIPLAVGFVVQVLFGALTYLVPVVLGGGAGPVRRANARLSTFGITRVTVINIGLLMWALPLPRTGHTIAAGVVLVGLASFLPLLGSTVWGARRGRPTGTAGSRPART